MRQVLLSGAVDDYTAAGALSISLLTGLIWAMIYVLLLEFLPNACNGLEYQADWGHNFDTAVYVSHVTPTTLGSGNISPASRLSHAAVYLEAITGTFSMAIVVASLIGARARHQ